MNARVTITKTGRLDTAPSVFYEGGMDTVIDFTQIDSRLPRITREQFEREYAERSRLSLDEFHRWLVAAPCECGELDCQGWQALHKLQVKREQRERRRQELEFERRQREARPSVYFAQLGDLIKIGFSKNPERRAEEVNGRLLGVCDGDRDLESSLHYEFRHLRERGEWFRAEPALLQRIGRICR